MRNKFTLICAVLWCVSYFLIGRVDAFQLPASSAVPDILPGTEPLNWDLPPSAIFEKMMEGAHQVIDKKIASSVAERSVLWDRDFGSQEAYERSVEPNRQRFIKYIGAVDRHSPPINYNVGFEDKHPQVSMQKISAEGDPELVAETETYRIYQVRWPVIHRVYAEGLLLQPKTTPVANVIALPDADQTPEQLAGLAPGLPLASQFARRLVENGSQVLIPTLIDRSPIPNEKNAQTNREWIYRQAYHMGRHVIGYEVQKVMSAVDWFKQSAHGNLKIGVAGYCEGGLTAFYSAAADKRIDAVLVSGYFNSRQEIWSEPLYRNVWGLLGEFGDAEIASLIAPRSLVVEHSLIPSHLENSGDKGYQPDKYTYTGDKGKLSTPRFEDVQHEFNRIEELVKPGFQARHLIGDKNGRPLGFGSEAALGKFAESLGLDPSMPLSKHIPTDSRRSFDPKERQTRQVRELEEHVQWLARDSDYNRNAFFLHKAVPELGKKEWSTKSYHPYLPSAPFIEAGKTYRKYLWEEVMGKFEDPLAHPNPRSRKIYDKELWAGYEVVLDVYEDLIAPGILLVPKDVRTGEKRPVVVVQHGRNGLPEIAVEGNTSYYDVAARLAERGFIVYVPYGLFRGEDQYRWLDRKANSVKKTLFSFIVSQHDQILRWLGALPFVDSSRIALYGKSFGGETAIRVPAVLEGYALSISSAFFGDWTRKVTDTRYPASFMNTTEWEIPYFNMGNTFSHAEMAYLIFPRPFMVERGRHDLVQPDEWVAYEYAKVSYLFDQFNLADKTEIEYFNGGHASRNEGIFRFLHKHLNWP